MGISFPEINVTFLVDEPQIVDRFFEKRVKTGSNTKNVATEGASFP
jgi:hypothetical protein